MIKLKVFAHAPFMSFHPGSVIDFCYICHTHTHIKCVTFAGGLFELVLAFPSLLTNLTNVLTLYLYLPAGCSPNPCVHGSCEEQGNGYKCSCDSVWKGTDCGEYWLWFLLFFPMHFHVLHVLLVSWALSEQLSPISHICFISVKAWTAPMVFFLSFDWLSSGSFLIHLF